MWKASLYDENRQIGVLSGVFCAHRHRCAAGRCERSLWMESFVVPRRRWKQRSAPMLDSTLYHLHAMELWSGCHMTTQHLEWQPPLIRGHPRADSKVVPNCSNYCSNYRNRYRLLTSIGRFLCPWLNRCFLQVSVTDAAEKRRLQCICIEQDFFLQSLSSIDMSARVDARGLSDSVTLQNTCIVKHRDALCAPQTDPTPGCTRFQITNFLVWTRIQRLHQFSRHPRGNYTPRTLWCPDSIYPSRGIIGTRIGMVYMWPTLDKLQYFRTQLYFSYL